MPPWIVEGWNPLGDQPARSDDQVFELLTAAVFQAALPPGRGAGALGGAGFDLAAVAAWPDERLPA